MILLSILDYIGSCAFCMSGAAMAYTLRMSLFGVFIMSLIAGYGGSCIRDTMLGNTPPILFQTPLYWYIAIFTVFFISLIKRQAAQVEKIVIIGDAVGLAAFTIMGVQKGIEAELGPIQCAMLGVISSCFGGIIRDVIANKMPFVLKDRSYAFIGFFCGLSYFYLSPHLNLLYTIIAVVSLIFIIRIYEAKNILLNKDKGSVTPVSKW